MPSVTSSATLVRYSCARWIGLRVWNAEMRFQPLLRKSARVAPEDLLDGDDGVQRAVEVERGLGALAELRGDLARRRQRHRDGPRQAVAQAPFADHALVVGAAHEPVERRERADRDQLQIGD